MVDNGAFSHKISWRRRHAQTIINGASSHKTNYIDIFSEIPNLEGHINHCIGSQVTAILLNGWILPAGGVALGRVCPATCAAGLFLLVSSRLFLSLLGSSCVFFFLLVSSGFFPFLLDSLFLSSFFFSFLIIYSHCQTPDFPVLPSPSIKF